MLDEIEQLAQNIRPADLLDIGVIACLLYCGLLWFRQRASRTVFFGLTLVAGLFLVARTLGMYLTTLLFQAGFSAVLLALIVIFQQDIRWAFQRLAAADIFRRGPEAEPTNASFVETLAEAVAIMAEQRTGALIVIPGREPLETHVRGGVAVDGVITLPLICSIFNPQSPGHDGAIVLREDRIEKLGVHLPLSSNQEEIGRSGTRHAAALGLAERCDALTLVVSEERGDISLAKGGSLRKIDPPQVVAELSSHYADRFQRKTAPTWRRRIVRNGLLKVTALLTACALWLLLAYQTETIQRTFLLPVEYRNLSKDLTVAEPRVNRAEITLSGGEKNFEMLDARKLAVSLDLGQVPVEAPFEVRLEEHLKNVPEDLEVRNVRPQVVEIYVRRADDGE